MPLPIAASTLLSLSPFNFVHTLFYTYLLLSFSSKLFNNPLLLFINLFLEIAQEELQQLVLVCVACLNVGPDVFVQSKRGSVPDRF